MAAVFTLSSSSIISISPSLHRFLRQRSCSSSPTTASLLPSGFSQSSMLLRLSPSVGCGRRGISVVTRAGPPSASTYIVAFLFPMSMLLATIFTSIKIDLKLDQDFLEELAINEGRMEADAEDESDDSIKEPVIPLKKPEAARTRNRPKREA